MQVTIGGGGKRKKSQLPCTLTISHNQLLLNNKPCPPHLIEYVHSPHDQPTHLILKTKHQKPLTLHFRSHEQRATAFQELKTWHQECALRFSEENKANTHHIALRDLEASLDKTTRAQNGLAQDDPQPGAAHAASCSASYPCESIVFGVLLPLCFGAYWLSDARHDVDERAGVWLEAMCSIRERQLITSLMYHHGKYLDARNAENREGDVYVLTEAWNCTVELTARGLDLATHRSGAPQENITWDSLALRSPDESKRCFGEVGQTLEEAEAGCDDWSPVTRNASVRCYAHALNAEVVYLTVDEPASFYVDLVVVLLCFCLAAFVFTGLVLAMLKRRRRARARSDLIARDNFPPPRRRDRAASLYAGVSPSASWYSSSPKSSRRQTLPALL